MTEAHTLNPTKFEFPTLTAAWEQTGLGSISGWEPGRLKCQTKLNLFKKRFAGNMFGFGETFNFPPNFKGLHSEFN